MENRIKQDFERIQNIVREAIENQRTMFLIVEGEETTLNCVQGNPVDITFQVVKAMMRDEKMQAIIEIACKTFNDEKKIDPSFFEWIDKLLATDDMPEKLKGVVNEIFKNRKDG